MSGRSRGPGCPGSGKEICAQAAVRSAAAAIEREIAGADEVGENAWGGCEFRHEARVPITL